MKTTETLQQNHLELTDTTVESEVFHFDATVAELGHRALIDKFSTADKRIDAIYKKSDPNNDKLLNDVGEEVNLGNYSGPQAIGNALKGQFFKAERQIVHEIPRIEAEKRAIESVFESRVNVSYVPTLREIEVRHHDIPESEHTHDQAA